MGGQNVGVGYLISALFRCGAMYEIHAAHPPTSSTHTISYAAELAIDPQTNKIKRSSWSAEVTLYYG